MVGVRDHLATHANALMLREKRNAVLASNIANAATPGFKARDFDFSQAMKQAVGEAELRTTHDRHIPTSGAVGTGLGYRQPLNPSMDGNTVELAVEQTEFSENSLRYQTSLQLLNRKISGLTRAIKGE